MLKAAPEPAVEPDRVRSAVDACDAQAADLQQLVNDCARFLPGFDARKAQAAIDAVVAEGAALRALAAPRKRFAFSRKAGAAAGASAAPAGALADTAAAATDSALAAGSGGSAAATTVSPAAPAASAASAASAKPRWTEDEHTIEGLTGRLIFVPLGGFTAASASESGADAAHAASAVHIAELTDASAVAALAARAAENLAVSVRAEPIAGRGSSSAAVAGSTDPGTASADASHTPGTGSPSSPASLTMDISINMRRAKDLRLLNLTDCVVILCDVTRAVRVDNLTRCMLACAGPTAGSVLLHGCEDSAFLLQSRQIRLHTSRRCTFLLSVMSRPIIEHCSGLRFGPNPLNYPALPDCLRAAGLPNIHAAPAPAHSVASAVVAAAVGAGPSLPTAGVAALPPGSVHAQWQAVDDFLWLRAQRSPNWDALTPEEWPGDVASACSVSAAGATDGAGGATVGGDGGRATTAERIRAAASAFASALRLSMDLSSPGMTAIAAAVRSAATEKAVAAAERAADKAGSAAGAASATALSSQSCSEAAITVIAVPAEVKSTGPDSFDRAVMRNGNPNDLASPAHAAAAAGVPSMLAATRVGSAVSVPAPSVAYEPGPLSTSVVDAAQSDALTASRAVATAATQVARPSLTLAMPAALAASAEISTAVQRTHAPAASAAKAGPIVAQGLTRVTLPVSAAAAAAGSRESTSDMHDDDEL